MRYAVVSAFERAQAASTAAEQKNEQAYQSTSKKKCCLFVIEYLYILM